MTPPRPVAQSWEQIEAWLAAHTPLIRQSLLPPAAGDELDRLEQLVEFRLPDDLRDSYRVHNGQDFDCGYGLFPDLGEPVFGPEPAFRLMTLARVTSEWRMMKRLDDSGEFEEWRSQPQEGIRNEWWLTDWLPIAENGGGDYFCIDHSPALAGTPGQVIIFYHDSPARILVAPSLAAWLSQLADGLQARRFIKSEDDDIVAASRR